VAGHNVTTHTLERIRADRAHQHTESQGFVDGEVEAISTGEAGDAYVKIQKVGGVDEEAKEEEETSSTESEEAKTDDQAKSDSETQNVEDE
jgi:hypothetical protein